MAAQWFCRVGAKELGPISAEQVLAMVRKGELSRDDPLRRGFDSDWIRVEEAQDFRRHFRIARVFRRTVRCLLLTVAALAIYMFFDGAWHPLNWWITHRRGTIAAYESYLQRFPNGNHASEAKENVESLYWKEASAAPSPESLQEYLSRYPGGRFAQEAKRQIEFLRWREAVSANTVASLQEYLRQYPSGRFVREVVSQRNSLLNSDAPLQAALNIGTKEGIESFLADFPGHARAHVALAALQDMQGRYMWDLINEGKIDVRATGGSIQTLHLSIRRTVSRNLSVVIPAGTYFVASNNAVQNMVSTVQESQDLTDDQWVELSLSVACANRSRAVPGKNDRFTVQPAPNYQLRQLALVLNSTDASFDVRQAAIWIATDDADYDALGTLSGGFGFGSRIIGADSAVRAMQMCERAGINIRGKAIWADRSLLLAKLQDEELRAWLLYRH